MEERGQIEIKIEGEIDGHKLSPVDVDISQIRDILTDLETFLYIDRKSKRDRPKISYSIEEGSVLHKFPTVISAIILFNGLIGEIGVRQDINFLDYKRASVIDKFQRIAISNNYSITLSSSINNGNKLVINKESNFFNAAQKFINSEFIIYGELYLEGGIVPNLHINSNEYGKLTISATKEQMTAGENKIYKIHGVRVSGKQNLETNMLSDLRLLEFIEYNPVFNLGRLQELIKRSKESLADIGDINAFVRDVRGGVMHG